MNLRNAAALCVVSACLGWVCSSAAHALWHKEALAAPVVSACPHFDTGYLERADGGGVVVVCNGEDILDCAGPLHGGVLHCPDPRAAR